MSRTIRRTIVVEYPIGRTSLGLSTERRLAPSWDAARVSWVAEWPRGAEVRETVEEIAGGAAQAQDAATPEQLEALECLARADDRGRTVEALRAVLRERRSMARALADARANLAALQALVCGDGTPCDPSAPYPAGE